MNRRYEAGVERHLGHRREIGRILDEPVEFPAQRVRVEVGIKHFAHRQERRVLVADQPRIANDLVRDQEPAVRLEDAVSLFESPQLPLVVNMMESEGRRKEIDGAIFEL